VIEIGANRAGEVAELVRFVQPGVGLVTNAGAEHLEGFGSLEGVARAEGEMFAGLAPTARRRHQRRRRLRAAVARHDARARGHLRPRKPRRLPRASTSCAASRAAAVSAPPSRCISPQGARAVELSVAGQHNVRNALAAAAAAVAAGASPRARGRGARGMRAGARSPAASARASGAWLIDDSYNANPELDARRHRRARRRSPAGAGW
jgi:UDP-N-acetylmuramoyl-tripeptide--D-alanyl-D-alanine ligase